MLSATGHLLIVADTRLDRTLAPQLLQSTTFAYGFYSPPPAALLRPRAILVHPNTRALEATGGSLDDECILHNRWRNA
jgi:hypothetical protein